LRYANLSGADLSDTNLRYANLSSADLRYANLSSADLCYANLRGADLSDADLCYANLSSADLRYANLSSADLCYANLSSADLSGADLRDANLSGADLRDANLSDVEGLLNPVTWLADNFHRNEDGELIVYKTFGEYRPSPDRWGDEVGEVFTEVVNPLRTQDCGCGINVATLQWVLIHTDNPEIWEIVIPREYECTITVPYNTDGKFRVGGAKRVRKITRDEAREICDKQGEIK